MRVNLTFVPCYEGPDCAKKEEIADLVSTNTFSISTSYNYIDFEEVNPHENPLLTSGKIPVFKKLDQDQSTMNLFL